MVIKRKFPIGAEIHPEGVHFRLWAPQCQRLDIILEKNQVFEMEKEASGYFSQLINNARPGLSYHYVINQKNTLPDPISRYQPQGPHGPSLIVDPSSFIWNDLNWKGVKNKGHSIYEMHIGTFTPEGTWQAAREKLPYLKDLGITLIEMMPIAEFPGTFGWGYDGVALFAPYHHYGNPRDLKAFINEAHSLNIGVILDVVYNHFGPEGNYLPYYSPHFKNEKMNSEWGSAINFDGPNADFVREFFITNALYWIEEYHFDGLRFDAVHAIVDQSEKHIIKEIIEKSRSRIPERSLFFVIENEAQQRAPISFKEGYGADSAWNDDFHHTAHVRLTGLREAYYTDYSGSLQEILSSLKYGYLYQGQYYSWQKKNRGEPCLNKGYSPFTLYLQNHDQIANSSTGYRIDQLSDPALLKLMTLILLLSPENIMLFQGQEWAASSPFLYFADLEGILAKNVWEGRKHFLLQFPSFNNNAMKTHFYTDPCQIDTFKKCILCWNEIDNSPFLRFHKSLLHLRLNDDAFINSFIDGAVIEEQLLLIRYFAEEENDRLILCNFGNNYSLDSLAEPLFAPPDGKQWKIIFSTQDYLYGGIGTPDIEKEIQGHTGLVFKAL